MSSFLFRRADTPERGQSAIRVLMAELKHLDLSKVVTTDRLCAVGGFADVYRGEMKIQGSKQKKTVAIKRFRVVLKKEEVLLKTFRRELRIWKDLKHDNVLPMLGVMTMDDFPCMVSEWMENGTMNEYMKDHADANGKVQGIASGLVYLHSREIVHSDLKGANVLVSQEGHALLCDFGIARLLCNDTTITGPGFFSGTIRWMAPELLGTVDQQQPHQFHTFASDVWAFGMTVFEAISRKKPFDHIPNDLAVIDMIKKGDLPSKPEHPESSTYHLEALYECCRRCRCQEPQDRPSMREMIVYMKDISDTSKPAIAHSSTGAEKIGGSDDSLSTSTGKMTMNSANLWNDRRKWRVSYSRYFSRNRGAFGPNTIQAIAERTTSLHGTSVSAHPKKAKRPPKSGRNSEFEPMDESEIIPSLMAVLGTMLGSVVRRRFRALQRVYSSQNSRASMVSDSNFVEDVVRSRHPELSKFSVGSYAAWAYWEYDAGFHAAFLLIDAVEESVPIDEQLRTLGYVTEDPLAGEPLRQLVRDDHFIIVTDAVNCSAFASVFIEAKTAGYFFIGFDPNKPHVDGQWTILAPKGTYTPSCYELASDGERERRYYPLYAMRAFHDVKPPAAKLGFQLPPVIRNLRQDIIMTRRTVGYNARSDFWRRFPPDDGDDDGGPVALRLPSDPPGSPTSPPSSPPLPLSSRHEIIDLQPLYGNSPPRDEASSSEPRLQIPSDTRNPRVVVENTEADTEGHRASGDSRQQQSREDNELCQEVQQEPSEGEQMPASPSEQGSIDGNTLGTPIEQTIASSSPSVSPSPSVHSRRSDDADNFPVLPVGTPSPSVEEPIEDSQNDTRVRFGVRNQTRRTTRISISHENARGFREQIFHQTR